MDIIRRQDAVNFMREYRYTNIASETIINMIPSAEKTGTWTEWKDDSVPPIFSRKWRCSCCGESNGYGKSKYCPNCGALMIDEAE